MYSTSSRSSTLAAVVTFLALVNLTHPGASNAASPVQFTTGIPQQAVLAPIEMNRPLIAGVQFNDDMLPSPEPSYEWYRIPSWFAGTWHRDVVTTVSHYDHKTGVNTVLNASQKAVSDDEEGWQKDSEGEYWNCDHTPFRSESLGEQCRQIFVVTSVKPLEVSADHIVKQFVGTGVLIDNATGKVKHSAQARSIQTYRLIKPGFMVSSSVTTEFDSKGEAVSTSKTETIYKQKVEFRAHDFHQGKDMRTSFKAFLTARGKPELAPPQTASLPSPLVACALD